MDHATTREQAVEGLAEKTNGVFYVHTGFQLYISLGDIMLRLFHA